jgi:hypothetical protein
MVDGSATTAPSICSVGSETRSPAGRRHSTRCQGLSACRSRTDLHSDLLRVRCHDANVPDCLDTHGYLASGIFSDDGLQSPDVWPQLT